MIQQTHEKVLGHFQNNSVGASQPEQFAEIVELSAYKAVLRVSWESIKQAAAKGLVSDLPVEGILIDEMAADEVARKVFQREKQVR